MIRLNPISQPVREDRYGRNWHTDYRSTKSKPFVVDDDYSVFNHNFIYVTFRPNYIAFKGIDKLVNGFSKLV